ncbi:unnamed protein product [Parascedosporium putredinis]|uniref:Uncharacterized protein n=1 Tax=Parascedosporium putredinis TaxID=1442378 RepID=A0A9P1HCD6_9PEZI|nr:unnamed protein product [Parascedosporium putredinis]CAI8004788.1 unnamed protein product [Parascedosporium putredinis]
MPLKSTPEKPAAAAPGLATPEISASDTKLLGLAFMCLKDAPVIDLEKFAKLGNYKNISSASSTWSRLKRRIVDTGKTAFPDASPGPSTPSGASAGNGGSVPGSAETPTRRKRPANKADAEDHDAHDKGPKTTPAKKQKRMSEKDFRKLLKAENDEDLGPKTESASQAEGKGVKPEI